jgi:AmiR/NasT family two-component response regulator
MMARRIATSADLDGLARELSYASVVQEATAQRQRADGLEDDVRFSRRIGIAVGIVMVTEGLPEQAALQRLASAAGGRGPELSGLAEEVIRHARLP